MNTRHPVLPLLRRQPLFAACSKRELQQLSRLCTLITFSPGERLTQQGLLGREFFSIVNGVATVERGGEFIGHSTPGSAVGERALLLHARRNATVTATSTVAALNFSESEFYDACNLSPAFEQAVLVAASAHS